MYVLTAGLQRWTCPDRAGLAERIRLIYGAAARVEGSLVMARGEVLAHVRVDLHGLKQARQSGAEIRGEA